MRLDTATWPEVEDYLQTSGCIIIPAGSTEQHGPMGLIGTDALVAQKIAENTAKRVACYVAPTLAYTPAPFNTGFPGTISISPALFEDMVRQIVDGLVAQGFDRVYFLNGHGANLAVLKHAKSSAPRAHIRTRSWWDFEAVNILRTKFYGDWEGCHATPSEISITQATHRIVAPGGAENAPEKLTPAYIKATAGDNHAPPDEHRRRFPDGRVGSHSALASPDHGRTLLEAAETAVADDIKAWLGRSGPGGADRSKT